MARIALLSASAILSLGAVLLTPGHAAAQDAPGRLSIHVDGMLFQPKASGSVFDLSSSELQIGASEYRHLRPSAEVALRVHPRVSLMAGWSSGSSEIESSILRGAASQSTELRLENSISAGLVLHLARWGNDAAWQLNVLGGIGRHSYGFGQTGVFPDASRPGMTFTGDFLTEGKADLQFAGLRLDRAITKRLGLSVGARYQWSEAEVSGDYQGFDPVSLAGFGITTGLRLIP